MKNKEITSYSNKKIVRDTYTHHTKSLLDFDQENLIIQKIFAINFGEDAMVIVSKTQLVIYGILTMKVFYIRKGWFWDAIFIPNTSLIAMVQLDGTSRSRRTLQILDLKSNQIISKLTIKFQIQQVKTSKNCICLVGIKQICVLHFPSLKPICHELAGSGLKIIFDISFEGLTLAYSSQKKGGVTVHNFSNVSTNRARRKSSQFLKEKSKSALLASMVSKIESAKKVVEIKAHHEFISIMKLSPNGTRIGTASNKGTVIRIFLTETGKLWQELRVGYELYKILDMTFYQQGNTLTCLTQKSMVFLFNARLQPQQQQAESEKRGYKIYQQTNPKSVFSFLSFFNSNLGQQHPFAFFKLIKPEDKKLQIQEINSPNIFNKKLSERQMIKKEEPMSVVEEEIQELQQLKKQQQPANQQKQSPTEPPKIKDQNTSALLQYKVQRSSSIQISETSSKRSKSLLQKLNIIHAKKDNYDYSGKIYNTVSKIFIGGNNFVWVAKGPYLFTLKYDPFNGGQMYHKETLKFC